MYRYFVSVAVFAKMNATGEGYYCNIDVHELYAKAKEMRIDVNEWPEWITKHIQQTAVRIRTK